MSILDRFVRRQPNLFARSELLPHQSEDLEAAETVLAAARRVAKQFGVVTSFDNLNAALVAAQSHDSYSATLKAAGVGVIDTAEALQYRKERLEPTLVERFKSWGRTVYQVIEEYMCEKNTAFISLVVSALVTVPLGIIWLIDTFWYDVVFWDSYLALTVGVFIPVVALVSAITANDEDAGGEFLQLICNIYLTVNLIIIGYPAWILATVFGAWFHQHGDIRQWVTLPVKDYQKLLPDSVVLSIDQVHQAMPKAKIELEVLEPAVGDKDEMFVTLPLGGTNDRLYLWHELAD